MKCKDIPDLPILEFIQGLNKPAIMSSGYENSVERSMPEWTPPKVQLAKMHMLSRRGLINGCTCGCRGDFELTEKGIQFLLNKKSELESQK